MQTVKAWVTEPVRVCADGKELYIDPNSSATPLKALENVIDVAAGSGIRIKPLLIHRGSETSRRCVEKAFESLKTYLSNYSIEFEEEVTVSRDEALKKLDSYIDENSDRKVTALVVEDAFLVEDKELKAVVRYVLFWKGYTNKFVTARTASQMRKRFISSSILAGIVARTVWPLFRIEGPVVAELRRYRTKIVCYDPTRLIYERDYVSAGTPVIVLEPDLTSMTALFAEEPLVHKSEADATYSLLTKLLADAKKFDGAVLIKHGRLFPDELKKISEFERSEGVRFSAILSVSKSSAVARVYRLAGEKVVNPPWGIVLDLGSSKGARVYRAVATWRPMEVGAKTVVPLTFKVYRNDTSVGDVDLIGYLMRTSAADIEAAFRPTSTPTPLWSAHRASKILYNLYTYSRGVLQLSDRYRLARVYLSMKRVNTAYGCYQLVVHGEGA